MGHLGSGELSTSALLLTGERTAPGVAGRARGSKSLAPLLDSQGSVSVSSRFFRRSSFPPPCPLYDVGWTVIRCNLYV
jgi:hypothetical protein